MTPDEENGAWMVATAIILLIIALALGGCTAAPGPGTNPAITTTQEK